LGNRDLRENKMRFLGFYVHPTTAVIVVFVTTITLFGILNITPGYAHDPIFIENTQLSPAEGPYLPNGNISFALYGRLENESDSRGFRSKLQAGEKLVLSLLIPNLVPEKLLPLEQLPTLTVERPDKSSIELSPEGKEVFDEPFTGTSYLRLLSMQESSQTGIYHITVNGNQKGRFTVSIGTIEQFGTPVDNVINRSSDLNRISDWYSDSPKRSLAHDRSRGFIFTDYLFVIFGIAALIFVLAVILVKIRITKSF
jgi:hypothetical protein